MELMRELIEHALSSEFDECIIEGRLDAELFRFFLKRHDMERIPVMMMDIDRISLDELRRLVAIQGWELLCRKNIFGY